MIELTGITAAIRLINKKTSDRVKEKTMQYAMTEAKNMAVHVYAPDKTGVLKSLIYKLKTGKLSYKLGCDAPWAVFHEFGSYNIDAGTPENPHHIKTGYAPFLRPAMWRVRKKMQGIFNFAFDNE